MPDIRRQISRGQVHAYAFGLANIPISQTDVQLIAADPSGNDFYVAAFDGEVIAVAWGFSAAPTAGTMTVGATFGGTEDADTTASVTVDSATTVGRIRVPRGKAAFTAGTKIGAEITTNGSFAPTTTDVTVTVYVLEYLEGI